MAATIAAVLAAHGISAQTGHSSADKANQKKTSFSTQSERSARYVITVSTSIKPANDEEAKHLATQGFSFVNGSYRHLRRYGLSLDHSVSNLPADFYGKKPSGRFDSVWTDLTGQAEDSKSTILAVASKGYFEELTKSWINQIPNGSHQVADGYDMMPNPMAAGNPYAPAWVPGPTRYRSVQDYRAEYHSEKYESQVKTALPDFPIGNLSMVEIPLNLVSTDSAVVPCAVAWNGLDGTIVGRFKAGGTEYMATGKLVRSGSLFPLENASVTVKSQSGGGDDVPSNAEYRIDITKISEMAWQTARSSKGLVATLTTRINQAYKKGDDSGALKLCQQGIALDPLQSGWLNTAGCCELQQKNIAGALTHFRTAAGMAPYDATIQDNLGIALKLSEQAEPALNAFRKSVELDPSNSLHRLHLAEAQFETGDYAHAADNYPEGVKSSDADDSMKHRYGLALLKLHHLQEADPLLRAACTNEPNSAANHYDLGSLLEEQGNLKESLAEFDKAIALDTTQTKYKDARAGVQKLLDEAVAAREEQVKSADKICLSKGYDKALPIYRRILGTDPNNANLIRKVSQCCYECRLYADCVGTLARLPSSSITAADNELLGNAQCKLGWYSLAETSLGQALRLDSKNLDYKVAMGNCLRMNKKPLDANAYFSEVVTADNFKNPEYLYFYAEDMIDLGGLKYAVDYLTRAILYSPQTTKYYFARGRAYDLQKNYKEAKEDFKFCFACDQDNKEYADAYTRSQRHH